MIIEYCATRLIPKMKIDFCPNKYRLILLSCPLQLISIDSRSPSGLQSLPNFKMVIKMCFNSRSPSGLRQHQLKNRVPQRFFNSRSPSGLRHKNAAIKSNKHSFNSRSPSGLRLDHQCGLYCTAPCFNSRSPSGLRQTVTPYGRKNGRFNSRSPSGLRLCVSIYSNNPERFQFTQPKRAATSAGSAGGAGGYVSIHAAQAGCDFGCYCCS